MRFRQGLSWKTQFWCVFGPRFYTPQNSKKLEPHGTLYKKNSPTGIAPVSKNSGASHNVLLRIGPARKKLRDQKHKKTKSGRAFSESEGSFFMTAGKCSSKSQGDLGLCDMLLDGTAIEHRKSK